MKRKRLWIMVSIVLTSVWLGGATAILIGQKDEASQRIATRLVSSCLQAPPGGLYPAEVTNACLEPSRDHEARMLMRVIESALLAGACAATFWALFALAFFGLQRSRGGRGGPGVEA